MIVISCSIFSYCIEATILFIANVAFFKVSHVNRLLSYVGYVFDIVSLLFNSLHHMNTTKTDGNTFNFKGEKKKRKIERYNATKEI